MNNNTKQFELNDVFALYDGRMFDNRNGLRGMMAVADFMVDEPVWIHDLGRIAAECRPYLADQFPWMEFASTSFEFDKSKSQEEIIKQGQDYIALLESRYGKMLDVAPIPQDDHTHIDPQTSLETLLRDAGRNPEEDMIVLDLSEPDDDENDDAIGTLGWLE